VLVGGKGLQRGEIMVKERVRKRKGGDFCLIYEFRSLMMMMMMMINGSFGEK
jgi:hypothetical protein